MSHRNAIGPTFHPFTVPLRSCSSVRPSDCITISSVWRVCHRCQLTFLDLTDGRWHRTHLQRAAVFERLADRSNKTTRAVSSTRGGSICTAVPPAGCTLFCITLWFVGKLPNASSASAVQSSFRRREAKIRPRLSPQLAIIITLRIPMTARIRIR